jgi:hypothetical protein
MRRSGVAHNLTCRLPGTVFTVIMNGQVSETFSSMYEPMMSTYADVSDLKVKTVVEKVSNRELIRDEINESF